MDKVHIFMDEFGNAHLDLSKAGTFSHFVYTAVVIKDENIEKAREIRYNISKKYLQGHIIKSSARSVGNNPKGNKKRVQILNQINELDFAIFTLVIDKSKLDSIGLSYHQVFYKYFSKIFLKSVIANYDQFAIYADKIGYPEFQSSLKRYIAENVVQLNLFNRNRSYVLADDKTEEPLIQFADFISGSIGKVYCTSHSQPVGLETLKIFNNRIFIDYFPYERRYIQGVSPDSGALSDKDDAISTICYEIAVEFLKSSDDKKVSIEAYAILEHLLIYRETLPIKLVETHELVKRIRKINSTYTETTLRTDIQKLRDQGVVIASIIGKSGYKIPSSVDDMLGFYNRYLNSIIPMLKRISLSNKAIGAKSVGEIKLLSEKYNLNKLSELIKIIE